jgi:hypothetical protein
MMSQMRFLFICFCCAIFASCDLRSDKLERAGEPDVYHVPGDDEEMNRATEMA